MILTKCTLGRLHFRLALRTTETPPLTINILELPVSVALRNTIKIHSCIQKATKKSVNRGAIGRWRWTCRTRRAIHKTRWLLKCWLRLTDEKYRGYLIASSNVNNVYRGQSIGSGLRSHSGFFRTSLDFAVKISENFPNASRWVLTAVLYSYRQLFHFSKHYTPLYHEWVLHSIDINIIFEFMYYLYEITNQ